MAEVTTKIGVLLANTGTPDAPTPSAVRRFLAQFLSDRRVIELPRIIWLPVLYGLVLSFRPRRSARLYRKIWTEHGSPLLLHAQAQARGVQALLDWRLSVQPVVLPGMRYGNPSIASALRQLKGSGVQRLLVLPLFPQYSAATTASILDAVFAELRAWRDLPALRTVSDYHDHPAYIRALACSLREYRSQHGVPRYTLMSFHGIPQSYVDAGDPYPWQCRRTAELAAGEAGLNPGEWGLAFQSRFGPQKWLQPHTDATLAELGGGQLEGLYAICPGFSADCLETLEEIALTGRETFIQAGGGDLHYVPALNDRPDHLEALVEIILDNIQGW